MSVAHSDVQIQQMIAERKLLPADWRPLVQVRPKHGHKERELDVEGDSGNGYQVIMRQSNFNPLDFSVILALRPANSNILFRVRRYNGKSHSHTNVIEGSTITGFHIHEATERYQALGGSEDGYAEATIAYSDFSSALLCMFRECGFEAPWGSHPGLFGEFET